MDFTISLNVCLIHSKVLCKMQGILSDVLKCLGDNKKLMRESTIKALDSWVSVVQLDKMVCAFRLIVFKII